MRPAIRALLLAACSAKEYHCAADQECVGSDGKFGLCIEMHCAFKDTGCTGGFRFNDAAGDQANMCATLTQVGAHRDAGAAGPGDAPAAD